MEEIRLHNYESKLDYDMKSIIKTNCFFIVILLFIGCDPTATPVPEISIKVEFKEAVNLFLNLDIPEGFILEELIVEKYEGKDEIAFFGIQKGETYTAGDDITEMISWGHFGPNSKDILYYSDNLEFKNKVKVTLDSGLYSIRFAQDNYKDANYHLIGKLIPSQINIK